MPPGGMPHTQGLGSPEGRRVAEVAMGCWRAPSSPLDEAWASLALGERPLSLCGMRFAVGHGEPSPTPPVSVPPWPVFVLQDYLFQNQLSV